MNDDEIARLEDAGVNYSHALDRFGGNSTLYLKLASKYPDDNHVDALCEAFEQGDEVLAEREAHSLKGLSGNLSLDRVYELSCHINELLRAHLFEEAQQLLPELIEAHQQASDAIGETMHQ